MCVFRVSDLLSDPESGFVIHHGEQVLHVPFDLDVEFIGSPCVADLWFHLVEILLHQSDILADPAVDRGMVDFDTLQT